MYEQCKVAELVGWNCWQEVMKPDEWLPSLIDRQHTLRSNSNGSKGILHVHVYTVYTCVCGEGEASVCLLKSAVKVKANEVIM